MIKEVLDNSTPENSELPLFSKTHKSKQLADYVEQSSHVSPAGHESDFNSVADLEDHHAPYNPRKADIDALRRLKKTMQEFGDLSGIVFNVRTQTLVGGHQRTKVLERGYRIEKEPHSDPTGTVARGQVETPYGLFTYREVDWPIDKEIAANLAANKGAGEWDFPMRAELLDILNTGAMDMDYTGHSGEEIERIFTWTSGDDKPAEAVNPMISEFKPREEHRRLKEFREDPENADPHEKIIIKVMLPVEVVDWLDKLKMDLGHEHRSDVIAFIVDQYREGKNEA